MEEPLSPDQSKKLVRRSLEAGEVRFSGHSEQEMADDSLETLDCINVLRGGFVEPAEFERGSWRYRVVTRRIAVVVAFRSETVLVVVTAWRFQ